MKTSLNISINLTTSKFASYLILIIGSIFSFVFQDSGTLLATFSAVSAILMMKTYTTSKTEQVNIIKGDSNTSTTMTTTGGTTDVTTRNITDINNKNEGTTQVIATDPSNNNILM